MKKVSILIIIFMHAFMGVAQDIHFSQFYNAPLMLNPALTGFHDGAHRFISNSRSQWASFTQPYRTFSFSYDMQPAHQIIDNDMLGIGFWAYGDQAGDSKMGIMQASLSLSYILALNNRGNNFLGFGLIGGWAQRQMSYENLYFDQQFTGEIFDPDLPTGEPTGKKSFSFYDVGTGVHWEYQPADLQSYTAGVSFSHMNRPQHSFTNHEDTPLPMKTMMYARMSIPYDINNAIAPGAMAAFQGNAREIVAGAQYQRIMSAKPYNYTVMTYGIHYRFNDAIILSAQLRYLQWRFGFSYDVNVSGLYSATSGLGGPELSIIYKVPRATRHSYDQLPCPIFF